MIWEAIESPRPYDEHHPRAKPMELLLHWWRTHQRGRQTITNHEQRLNNTRTCIIMEETYQVEDYKKNLQAFA